MFSLQTGERVSFFCRISRIARSGLRILGKILWLRREVFGTKYLPKEFFCETEFRFRSTRKQNSVSTLVKVEKVSHPVFTTKK
jgi:hypothetical protein